MIRYVLWSGGIDSTYMVSRMLDEDIEIQPLYMVLDRAPLEREEIALSELTVYFGKKNKKARLNTVEKVYGVKPSSEIESAYGQTLLHYSTGPQFMYLTEMSRRYFPLYAGVEHFSRNLLIRTERIWDNSYKAWRVVGGRPDLVFMMKDLFFPILGVTRKEMVAYLRERYPGALDRIWFCLTPTLDGKPCGMCENCRGKIEDGVGELLPPESVKNYWILLYLLKYFDNPKGLRLFDRTTNDAGFFTARCNLDEYRTAARYIDYVYIGKDRYFEKYKYQDAAFRDGFLFMRLQEMDVRALRSMVGASFIRS